MQEGIGDFLQSGYLSAQQAQPSRTRLCRLIDIDRSRHHVKCGGIATERMSRGLS